MVLCFRPCSIAVNMKPPVEIAFTARSMDPDFLSVLLASKESLSYHDEGAMTNISMLWTVLVSLTYLAQ